MFCWFNPLCHPFQFVCFSFQFIWWSLRKSFILVNIHLFVSLFRVFRPTREFLLIWRRDHCRWRAKKFDLCFALMAIEQWWHTYCETGHPFIKVISEDPWHSHLLLNVWNWRCHNRYLFLRLRSWDANTQPSACEATL